MPGWQAGSASWHALPADIVQIPQMIVKPRNYMQEPQPNGLATAFVASGTTQ